jgi:DNA-binding XRE family transcriptional regulator
MMIDGRVLKIVRRRCGYTQERLSELSKVSRPTIARIEKACGSHPCKGPTIKRLADALDVDSDLLTSDAFQSVVDVSTAIAVYMTGKPIDIDGLRRNMDELIERCIRLNVMFAKMKNTGEFFSEFQDIPKENIGGPYRRIRHKIVVDLSENQTGKV